MMVSPQHPQRTPFNPEKLNGAGPRVLPGAVIYGPNASGKSNVIKAAGYMREIVVAGLSGANKVYPLALCPFIHETNKAPISFDISFITGGERFDYGFAIALCDPFAKDCEVTIISERLVMEGEPLFERTEDSIKFFTTPKALRLLGLLLEKGLDTLQASVNSNRSAEDLFLTGGLKSVISKTVASKVISFFENEFISILDVDSFGITGFTGDGKGADQALNRIKEMVDVGPQVFHIQKLKEDAPAQIFSRYKIGGQTKTLLAPIDWMESRGTIQALNIIPVLLSALQNGATILVDELDASLHPALVKSIIATFNDAQLNPHHAQLIFTSQNLIYLNKSLLRRDQILFTEKDENYVSELYSLADFGSIKVRNDTDYLKMYLKGNFGALPSNNFAQLAYDLGEKAQPDEVAQ